jgi:predicted nuclease of predicted toxin-antitoxin system
MNFLVDAQLPRRLALAMRTEGHDVLHTLDLRDGNQTTDETLNVLSEQDGRIVVTKDADFVNSFLVAGRPHKLLLISTGNITNRELEALFLPQLPHIVELFQEHRFLELNRTALIIHS